LRLAAARDVLDRGWGMPALTEEEEKANLDLSALLRRADELGKTVQ
jgi:hypothetical protein